jgi:hypothetical protein
MATFGKRPTSRLIRWRLKLAEYEYEVVHKVEKMNVNADALSRNPIPQLLFPLPTLQETNINSPHQSIVSNKQIHRDS